MSFGRFLLVRLGWAFIALWLAATIVFFTFRVITFQPRDLVGPGTDPLAAYRAYAERAGLQYPIPERYARFLAQLVTDQSAGRSVMTERSSRKLALESIPATLALVLPGLILALLLASALAIPWSRAGPRRRHLWRLPSYLALGLVPMWLGLELSYIVGFKGGWLPITGYCDFFDPQPGVGCGGAVDWTKHLVIPWITVGIIFAAVYVRILRVVLKETAAATRDDRRGDARRWKLMFARVIGRDFGLALGAAVFIEMMFSIPGIASQAVRSAGVRDAPLAETLLLYAAFLGIAVHFLVDVTVGALDEDLRVKWPFARIHRPA
jgi:peptide/nickel transport system permease protein